MELVGVAAHLGHRAVQRAVPRLGRHVVQAEVGLADRGKDARQQDLDTELSRDLPQLVQGLVEPLLHVAQAAAGDRLRVEIQLQVEQAELGGEPRIVDTLEQPQRGVGGPPAAVDQEHLLLGPDTAHVGLDQALFQDLLQGPHVVEQTAHEGTAARAFRFRLDRVAPHGRPPRVIVRATRDGQPGLSTR